MSCFVLVLAQLASMDGFLQIYVEFHIVAEN